MKPIIENKALHFSMTGDGPRPKVQYDRASTTDFIERLNASARPTTIEGLLGIPRYAVEQLVCLGELRHEDHPAIALLHGGLRIAAFSTYFEGLIDAGSTGLAPSEALTLSRAMRRIGGRDKPWGEILRAMRSGHLEFCWRPKGSVDDQFRSSSVRRYCLTL
jgi:hypothetical protein